MFGRGEIDRQAIMWVTQKDAFGASNKNDGGDLASLSVGQGISTLIGDEVDKLSVDPHARHIQAAVAAALGELQTQKTQKPSGRLLQAMQAVAQLEQQIAAAEDKLRQHTQRLDDLARLTEQRDAIAGTGPNGLSTLALARDKAGKRLAESHDARREARQAEMALETSTTALQLAQQNLERIVTADAEIASALAAVHQIAAILANSDEIAVAEASVATERDCLAALKAEVDCLEHEMNTARADEAAVSGNQTRKRLTETIDTVRSLQADRDQALSEAQSLAAFTPEALAELTSAEKDRDRRDVQFAAVAPDVTIALTADGEGHLTVDGAPLVNGAVLRPDTPLVIEIAGVGRITIAPHPETASAPAQTQRIASRQRVVDLLAGLGVNTLADAATALDRRSAAERRMSDISLRLKQAIPAGLDQLIGELAAVARCADTAQLPRRSSIDLQNLIAGARQKLAAGERALTSAMEKYAQLDVKRAASQAAMTERARRLDELRAARGADADVRAAFETATKLLADARATDTDARLTEARWRDIVHDLAIPDLEAAAAGTLQAYETAIDHKQQIALAISRIDAELAMAAADDAQGEQSRLADELAVSRRKLRATEDERAALMVLSDEFAALNDAGRDLISGPVRARIEPYLATIFPAATMALDGTFAPSALKRGSMTESLDRLSQGTREQIAIITRLGLGKLLAERQAGVPLILDDALVFADDERIEALFDALQTAALDHQVIIFTCRTKSFASLIGRSQTTALTLAPWRAQALV